MLRPQLASRPARQPLQRLSTSSAPASMAAARTARPLAAAIHTAGPGARIPRIPRVSAVGARSIQTCSRTPGLPSQAGQAPPPTLFQRHRLPHLSSSSPLRALSLSGRLFFSTTLAAREAVRTAQDLPRLDKIVAVVAGARDNLLAHPGLPSQEETATALRICGNAADLIMDTAVQPQLSTIDHQADTAASALLSMDNGNSAARAAEGSASAADSGERPSATTARARAAVSDAVSSPALQQPRFREVVARIADAAFAIIDDPRVVITPGLLEQYVRIQARLGRPETLPYVLEQYTAKETPKLAGESITYAAASSPASPSKCVATTVAETALDTALAAKNLDAAVGIIEYTYAAPAFERNKLMRRGLLPAFVVVGLPLATYLLAGRLAAMQTSMDEALFTNIAFAAILVYIGCTGTMGVVANATSNDQMKRVTWAPGTPLRERWLREEERAALDKVACAFGFSDELRFGEEEGPEFQALRDYVRGKGMLVDQTELLEGMND